MVDILILLLIQHYSLTTARNMETKKAGNMATNFFFPKKTGSNYVVLASAS